MLATRLSDVNANGCGPPGPHVSAVPSVLTAGAPACVLGSVGAYPQLKSALCLLPGPYTIITGSMSGFIGGSPAARVSDGDSDTGVVVTGAGNVLIG